MSDTGKSVTHWVVIVAILLIGLYDLIALQVWGVDATISRVVGVEGSFDAPTIPFVVGFIMGHLFWPQKGSYRASLPASDET